MTDSHETRHTVRSVSIGAFWRLLRYPFMILSMIVVPRLMGTATYGQFAFFMAIYLVLDILTDVGITQTSGRFLPEIEKEDENAPSHFLHGILFYGVLITLGVIVLIVAPLAFSETLGLRSAIAGLLGRLNQDLQSGPDFKATWWIILCLLLLTAKVKGTLFAFMYGRNEIARYSSKELIRSIASFILVVGLFLWFGLDGALWALLLNELFQLVIAVYWTRRQLFRRSHRIRFSHFKPYLLFGIKFYVPMLAFGFLQRSGVMLVRWLSGSDAEAGIFDIANQFLVLTSMFLGMILSTMIPSITSLYVKDSHDTILKWHRNVMTYCGVAVFLAFHAVMVIGRHVIVLVLGREFAPVYESAATLALALPLALIAYAGMNLAILEKKPLIYVVGVFGGLISMIGACVYLVPAMGATGAAWASVCGYTVLAVVFGIKYRKQFAGMLGGMAAAIAAGALVAPVCLFSFSGGQAVSVFVLTTTVYVAVVLILKIVRISDAKDVWKAIREKKAET